MPGEVLAPRGVLSGSCGDGRTESSARLPPRPIAHSRELGLVEDVVAVCVESVEYPSHPNRELFPGDAAVFVEVEVPHTGDRIASGAASAAHGRSHGLQLVVFEHPVGIGVDLVEAAGQLLGGFVPRDDAVLVPVPAPDALQRCAAAGTSHAGTPEAASSRSEDPARVGVGIQMHGVALGDRDAKGQRVVTGVIGN